MPEQELLSFPGGKLVNDMKYGEEGVRDYIVFFSALCWWNTVRNTSTKKKRAKKKRVKR